MASTFTNLLFHVVYSTKYRRALIQPDFREELYKYISGIIREQDGTSLEIGGMPDHIHILAKFTPSIAVSDMLRLIKANSSKWINEKRKLKSRFDWQTGFAAFSVSQSQVPVVAKYIQSQEKHHQKKSFKVEFVELLKRNKIEYDNRYLFEKEHIT